MRGTKNRNYNWKFDPATHVFGKHVTVLENGAKNCLQPDFAQNEFPRTRIVKKNVEDYRNFREEPIGKVLPNTVTHSVPEPPNWNRAQTTAPKTEE